MLVEEGRPPVMPGSLLHMWINGAYHHQDDRHRVVLDEEPGFREMCRIMLRAAGLLRVVGRFRTAGRGRARRDRRAWTLRRTALRHDP